MKSLNDLMKRAAACALGGALLACFSASAATDIFNEPLAQPASNVKPNIMLLYDDSGSMREQYTPDYIGRYFGGSNALCYDSADGGSISSTLENCQAGDPPLMSPDFNFQYYNPEIRYFPAVNADGTAKPSMNSANTSNWTAVPTDNVSSSTVNTFRRNTLDMNGGGSQVDTANLASQYPDRAWCNSQSANHLNSANYPATCRLNSNYTYPNLNYGYGQNTDGTRKYVFGAPYYYRIRTTEYCTDATLTTCVASTAPTGSYTVPAPVRFCDSTNLDNCQGKYQGSYTRPKFTGKVDNGGASNPSARATATITVTDPQSDNLSGTITAIYINGTNVVNTTIGATAPINGTTTATSIASAINTHVSSPDFSATSSGNVVTISAPADGASYNGFTIVVESPVLTKSPASVTISVSGVGSNETLSNITTAGVNIIGSSIQCTSGGGCFNSYSGPNGASGRDGWMAVAIAGAINGLTATNGYTAAQSGRTVTITAPAGSGAEVNGRTLTESSGGFTVAASSPSTSLTFTGGSTSGDIETTVTVFAGGKDANEGRIETGQFVRTDIVPYQDAPTNSIPSTFAKYPARTDCAGASCTYDEEMTNFANWYAYYRSRAQMAKTAIGRAFVSITDSYRVGFLTINPSNPVNSGRFLAIDDFAGGDGSQKSQWYDKLYGTADNGSTPLREALSRAGHYFAGSTGTYDFGGAASPIQVSCQPSYTILVTDGYWNGNEGRKLNGTTMDNQDNVNSGYSTQAYGAWDGNILPTTTAGSSPGGRGTLADVAMYYYKTDLRSDLADNVPTTTKDTAPHQHMTTFAVGLGLAGRLNFDSNYEEQASGDFKDIKQGVKNWPSPQADSETALDDLWHAAVNGRGTFFSARDPLQLSSGITQTLTSVQSRVGAGAAAATSNLQPVAGDNFAFTAQFQTVEWTGDLKARTIDLSTGIIASRELWSAQALLDQRNHYNRRIYTFDAGDVPAPGGSGPAAGNGLRNLCWPGASTTSTPAYAGCNDDANLTAAEMTAYFDPLALSHAASWPTDLSGRDVSATSANLLDYLRGDASNEMTGGSATTDLYRNRNHLLGDIVNAQPAYVKAPPFNYSATNNPFYSQYRSDNATRKGSVYVAANDGMLHAFETDPDNNPYFQTAGISTGATTDDTFSGSLDTSPTVGEGAERWAYVPSMILPKLKDLATVPYTHQYFVDGSPVIGDVCFGHTAATPCSGVANWRTILVAGLNSGGRGYYALDVTNPDTPKALWEFRGGSGTSCIVSDGDVDGTQTEDCNIGLSFGNPIITKLPSTYSPSTDAGRWVVILTSGYNNVSPGDGIGHFYIIDAQSGKLLKRVSTGVGDSANPSGLARINAWSDNATVDNTSLTVYAGDLSGNVWRFQLENTATVPTGSLTRLATVVDPSNAPQHITTKPELALVSGQRIVYIATGRFLGTSDKTDEQRNSIYAIKDPYNSTTDGLVPMTRSGSYPDSTIADFVRQDLTPTTATERTTTIDSGATPVDFTTQNGWFIDLPDGGTAGNPSERVNVDPILQLGTLVVASNVPIADACVAGGYGWLNFLDYKTGGYIVGSTANMASQKLSGALVVGINVIQLPGGAVKTEATLADNQVQTKDTPTSATSLEGRRVTWRELIVE